jgi:hypothetical protein
MNSYFSEQYIKYFNKFINQIKVYYMHTEFDEFLNTIHNLSDVEKINQGKVFVESISNNNFKLFLQSKLKVFSHKNNDTKQISESLFGPKLALKQLLNNQTDDLKKTVWAYLHVLYLYAHLLLPLEQQNEEHIKQLSLLLDIIDVKNIENNTDINSRIYNLLNVEVNSDTKTMIEDIVNSFNPLMDGTNKNPLANIMQISQTISSKYSDKICRGDIELDKIMDSIKDKIPGMEGIINNFTNMKNTKPKKPKEKVIINENYSTANIDVGEDELKKTGNFNIGNILKAADTLGLVPNTNKPGDDVNNNSLSDMLSAMTGSLSGKAPDDMLQSLLSSLPKNMTSTNPDTQNADTQNADNTKNEDKSKNAQEIKMPDMSYLMNLLSQMQQGKNIDLNNEFSKMGLDVDAINQQVEAALNPQK